MRKLTEKQPIMQPTRLPEELAQQASLLNARIVGVNLAIADLLKEVDIVFGAMTTKIAALDKENSELKHNNSVK